MSAVLVSVVLKGTDNHRASRAGRDPQPPPRPAPGSAQEHPKIKIQTIPLIERHPKYPGSKVSHAKNYVSCTITARTHFVFKPLLAALALSHSRPGDLRRLWKQRGSANSEELEKRMGSRSVNRY